MNTTRVQCDVGRLVIETTVPSLVLTEEGAWVRREAGFITIVMHSIEVQGMTGEAKLARWIGQGLELAKTPSRVTIYERQAFRAIEVIGGMREYGRYGAIIYIGQPVGDIAP